MENALKQDTSYLQLERNYNKAQQMQKIGIDNETIRQNTNWFQDKNGDWKFEFSDKDMSLKKNIKLEKSKTYKLGQILEHDTLFEIYPELANYDVKVMSDNEVSGVFSKINKRISISDKLINNNKLLEGTLIHEIQHAIQNIEGFEGGKKSRKSKLAYYNSLGEIEASNTKDRFIREKYNNENINSIAPESSKTNPQHKNLNSYLNNRNLLDKVKDSMYNYFNNKNGGKSNEVNEKMDFGHNRQDSLLVDKGKYRRYVNDKNGGNNNEVNQEMAYSDTKQNSSLVDEGYRVLNNKVFPMQSYQYEKSDNYKIDNLRRDASKFFNNTDIAHNFINMLEKIIGDKDIEIRLDANLKTEDGRVANGSYQNGVITINPNSNKAGEFIAIHELTHAIGTKQMLNMVDNYRKINTTFNASVETLLENYKKTELTEEALSDVSGQLFGNQEFINSLSQKNPNLFKKIYNEIKYLWHQFRGYKNQNQFINDLQYKWEQAYRKNNKLNDTTNYSIQTDNNGNKYVKVDTDQNIFEGIDEKDYNKIAKMYMQDYLIGETTLSDTDSATIDSKSTGKYTNPKQKGKFKIEKMQLTPELKNVLEIAKKESVSLPVKENSKYRSWEYYKFNFELDGKQFEGTVNIGIDKDGNKHFYEINKIHTTSNLSVSTNTSSSKDFINNSILPTKDNVNRNTTKYSMQESENNSGSFNLPTKQWSQYLEDNFEATGARTNLNEIKLPTKEYFENKNVKAEDVESNDIKSLDINAQNDTSVASNNSISQDNKKTNKINEKVREYIDSIGNNFETDIEISTKSLNEDDIIPIKYKSELGQSVIRKKAESLFSKLKRSIFTNNNEQIYVTNTDIRKSISETFRNKDQQSYIEENLSVFSQLDKIIENGKEIASSKNDSKGRVQYSDYKYYVTQVKIDGKPYIVEFDTRMQKGTKGQDERHFRLERIYNYEETSLSAGTDNSITRFSDKLVSNNSISQDNKNINNFGLPTKEYFENKEKVDLLTDKDYEVLNKIYEKEGKTEVLTEKKKASLLEKYASDKFAIKDSLDILAQKFVNKGHYIDKLAKEANNPELKFIYDKNLNSFAEGQYVVGVAQTDNNGNTIGKSINDIWSPLEENNLVKEFSEYLLHKHNIARSGQGKYIFGDEIGPTESTSIALKLEQEHPEFKEYAKSIKEFNHNNLNNLKESGLVSQDTIDYLEAMYPDYIVISRSVEDSLYSKSNDNTGTTAPIKKATGGNADIQPIKDAMASQAIRIKRLINQNELGKQLAMTLKNAKVEENCDVQVSPAMLLDMESMVETDNSGNKFYIYFEDGKQVKLKINDNLFESLKPTQISRLEKTLPFKVVQKVSSVHRSLLTSSNPIFVVTNFFKDFQDGMFNSKYSRKFIKNYGKALNEIYTKGKYYQSYMANGGMTNTYFDYNDGVKKKSNKFVEKIRNVNEIVEELPRLSEFISTLEDGKSLNEALYNASEITTNFKRGGDITKAINRNGVNFLNASIQGLDKLYRNISGQNGIKGYVNLLAKATIMSIAPAILNHILLDDDEDYQDLPQSTKDLYYLFKTGDGKFIRIPKGRVLSIFGSVARRSIENVQGQDDAWDGFGDTVMNQIAPNNPLEDNILAPIMQVKNNKTWYGGDLVSSRLQKELPKNQYDETTDEFSKWLGGKLNISPKKINYLLDQYSGGIGDVLLPAITPQAKQNVLVDKFTTDSVLKNKNVSKFYATLEKQTQIANDSFATDEDKLKLKYLNSISSDMGDLYKEKRAVQMSNISNTEKTNKVREIQAKINELAEKGLNDYVSVKISNSYSEVGDQEYYKNTKGQWSVLSAEKKDKVGNLSFDVYSDYMNKVSEKKEGQISDGKLSKGQDLKTVDKIQILLDSKYSNKNIQTIYEQYLGGEDNKEYAIMKASGINIKEYLKYKQQKFEADKKDDGTVSGKSISGSKKKKVYNYVNSMKISYNQKLLLLGQQYKLTDDERGKLAKYVNSMKISKKEKLEIYGKLQGFTVYKNGTVKW